jgi:hypothetical protein
MGKKILPMSLRVLRLLPISHSYGRVFHPQILLHQLIADTTISDILQADGSDGDGTSDGPYCELTQIRE